jgi:hypothetical protein
VATATTVTVQSGGAVHRYPWLPLWMAGAGAAVLVGWIAASLRRAESEQRVCDIGRRVILMVTGSACVFLLVSTTTCWGSGRTKYYDISMAIADSAQKDLIGDLQRVRPRLVVSFQRPLLTAAKAPQPLTTKPTSIRSPRQRRATSNT